MIRPSIISKPKKLQQHPMSSLVKINIKLAIRNIIRHKAFSAINLFGLALALCVSMFIANMLYTGYRFDTQHPNADRVYRIANTVTDQKGKVSQYASLPYRAAEQFKSDIPDFEAVTHFKKGLKASFRLKDEEVTIYGLKVDSAFFDVFNFKVLAGNPLSIFSDINSVILTEGAAERYFPGENPIGLKTANGLVVKAILESPKLKSHLRFEALGRLESTERTANSNQRFEYKWGYYLNDYAYVRVKKGVDLDQVKTKLQALSDQVNRITSEKNDQYAFFPQPLKGITYSTSVLSDPGFTLGKDGLISYLVMIGLMLFIASFNYTNLSISRAIQRTKEIGIRKVSGSTKGQIMFQILCETLVLSFIAFAFSLVVYKAISNDFLAVMPALSRIFNPHLPADIILLFSAFTLITGLVAGIFPAIFFSGINPLSLFNPRIKRKRLSFVTIRKVLVTFQLTLSMFAVIFTILMKQQITVLEERPKGFETENKLVIKTDLEKASLLKTALMAVPGVEAVTLASDVPGDIVHGAVRFFDPMDNDTSLVAYALTADAAFDEVIEPELLSGQFFSRDFVAGTQHEILVNQEFLELTKIDLSSAVGTVINSEKKQYKIAGVLQPMISHPPFIGPNQPFMIVADKVANNPLLMVKLSTNNTDHTFSALEAAWKSVYPDDRFKPEQMETHLQKPVKEFKEIMKAQNFIAFAIIAIALLGQLGMAMYNAEIRVKEISIRKVLGAPIGSVLKLLLKGTVVPLVIAGLIASPLAYLLFQEVLGMQMSNPLQPHIGHFSVGISLLSILVVGMVVSQTWRVAVVNPVKSLRSE
ncbi:MAG: ABC transporter permease [Roseivirga sp.]